MSSTDEHSRAGCAAVIRPATRSDLVGILEIENREIRESFAHFGGAERTLDDLTAAWELAGDMHPWLVAEVEGQIAAFARAAPWKDREAYRWTVEIGVYVGSRFRARGIASALYEALFPLLQRAGAKTVVAGIALPNEPSVRLHERFGLKPAGILPKVGWKFGEWRDVGYWVRHFEGKSEDL